MRSFLRYFTLLRADRVWPPLAPYGESPPAGIRTNLSGSRSLTFVGAGRARPQGVRFIMSRRSGHFEGQRQDPAAIADRVATYGLKVFCTECGKRHRHFTRRGIRLRSAASPCCGARMHPSAWPGWEMWSNKPPILRREEVADNADARLLRIGKDYYMRGIDS